MSHNNPNLPPVTFPVSALDVANAKLAAAEAVLAAAVRANFAAESPMDAANSMVMELQQWDGYSKLNVESLAGTSASGFALVATL